jgi:uncharacterized protein YjbJ (UPF0337 family)
MMKLDNVKGERKQIKGKVEKKWRRLTDDELNMVEGKRGQFVNESYRREGVNNKIKGGYHE